MIESTINDAVTLGGADALLAGRYRVVRQLGQGGMGSVYLAEDAQLDNFRVAIKMLPAILVANKRALKQLKAEALVSMKLTHSNIVPLRGFEENNGNSFLVMDYIEGQTLDDLLAEKEKLTEEETIRILSPVAAALDYAHTKGVVHRDVKPGNVMIAKDGTPYILDFGIAREIQETMTRVTGKFFSGTLPYMSPEQLRGQAQKPTQDIYSFAVMAYECLKGEPPFARGQIEFQILNEQPEPLPGGTQLVASVMAGLAKNPEDRPATCTAVLEGKNFTQRSREVETQSGRAGVPRTPPGGTVLRLHSRATRSASGSCLVVNRPVTTGTPYSQLSNTNSKARESGESNVSRKVVIGLFILVGLIVLGGLWWESSKDKPVDSSKKPENGKPMWSKVGNKNADSGMVVATEAVKPERSENGDKKAHPGKVVATEVIKPTQSERGVRRKVQLWEGGPYWACKNIGADEPWEFGYYFWLGDTVGYKRQSDAWVASDGSRSNFSFEKRNTPTYGKEFYTLENWRITVAHILAPEHDAAHVQWGGAWRMPTKQELDDLKSRCDWTWATMNGVDGYVVRGRGVYASSNIFLPAAGHGYGTSLNLAGSAGTYWSSVPDSYGNLAYGLSFGSDSFRTGYDFDRFRGHSVRPVQGFTK